MADDSFNSENAIDILDQKDKEIESLSQQIHHLLMAVKTKSAMETELTAENETLQSKLALTVKQQQDEINDQKTQLVGEFKTKKLEIESELQREKEQCSQLEAKITELQETQRPPENDGKEEELTLLRSEVKAIAEKHSKIVQDRENLSRQLHKVLGETKQMQEQMEAASDSSEHYKQQCQTLREKVETSKEELERAEEELQTLRVELMSSKTSQVEEAEARESGNSLFKEVEDRRKAAILNLKQASVIVTKHKQELIRAHHQSNQLRMENAKLHEEWKKYEDEKIKLIVLDSEVDKMYKSMIEDLRTKIAELQKDTIENTKNTIPKSVDLTAWLQTRTANYEKKIEALELEIFRRNAAGTLSEHTRLQKMQEMNLTMVMKKQLECTIKELRQKLEEGGQQPPEPQVEKKTCSFTIPEIPINPLGPAAPQPLSVSQVENVPPAKAPECKKRELPELLQKLVNESEKANKNKPVSFAESVKQDSQYKARPKRVPVTITKMPTSSNAPDQPPTSQ